MTFDLIDTILFSLIIVLAGYIIYLHVKLVRKNMMIESVVRKIAGIEKELSTEDIRKVISEIHNLRGRSILFDDKLFDEDVLNFLLSSMKDSITFIHYTKDIEVAEKIIHEGFRFAESFYKTALQITNDKLDLVIKHNNKKFYGDYIVIICISNDIVRHYTSELEASGVRNLSFENILTEKLPEKNENSDNVYILSEHFIKGYLNYRTGEIFKNPAFDPGFSSPVFSRNISVASHSGR